MNDYCIIICSGNIVIHLFNIYFVCYEIFILNIQIIIILIFTHRFNDALCIVLNRLKFCIELIITMVEILTIFVFFYQSPPSLNRKMR